MARSSGGSGSRFASSNLNDLYGKQALSGVNIGSGGSKSRYLHGSGTSHGGMLVLARPVRTPPSKQVKPAQPKLTVPAPVNLPSLRKEHAGNDPNITLVGGTGVSGWSKQQVSIHQQQSSVEDPSLGDAHIKSNGWGISQSQQLTAVASTDSLGASGKYTPPAARGSLGAAAPAAPVRSSSAVVLRGEDFPTLQAAAPFNPVPSQQRQREIQQRQKDKQREAKHQQAKLQQLSQNQFEKENEEDGSKPPSPVLTLQPQSKQGGPRDDSVRINYFSLKENRKPNDLSLRPGPLIHLNHTSNWADDERETASMSKPAEWEDPPRYHGQVPFGRPSFQRDERSNYRREMPHSGDYGRSREMQDFGWDREGHSGRGDWAFGRNGGFDRMEIEESRGDSRGNSWRLRDSYHHNRDSFARESFFNKPGGGDRGRFGARNGGFDLPVKVRSPYSEDTFMRDFPELPNLDFRLDLKYRVRKKREDVTDGSYRDLERESFETELERVQKEQEQERQKKIEERERSLELARKEEEERERLVREEEERQRKLEEEAREAAARAEQEALDSVRKVEEAKRVREEEKRRMLEEDERRKENARRKLLELEERIARRQMQSKSAPESPNISIPATKANTVEDNDERPNPRLSSHRVQQDQTRLRSPDIHSIGRDRGGDDRPRFSSSSWRRDFGELSPFDQSNNVMHSPGRRMPDEAENFYGNTDASSDNFRRDREEKWSSNGDHMRNAHFSRSNSFMDQPFGEDDRRWGRRPRENRPFSPPSPTSYGSSTYEVSDGLSYGRLRQSLPKQPRVLPPPTRTQAHKTSSVFPGSQSPATTLTSHLDVQEESTAITPDVVDGENVSTEQKFLEDEACGAEVADIPDEVIVADIQTSVEDDQAGSLSPEEENETLDGVVKEIQMSEHNESSKEANVTSEQSEFKPSPEIHDVQNLDTDSSLSELVDSIVVIPKTEVVEATELEAVTVVVVDDEKAEAKDDAPEATQPTDVPARPLLPSPLRTTQPPLQQPFHHHPNFVPTQLSLLDPRPRMQSPHPERPMTLQFGLLPGTTLLQGSVPAIQIGSIQMPLQLHPPIGHHVAHLQPPPPFQFGQIGQQAPLLPSFTVHPQAVLQPSMMNVDGQQGVPGQQFRMQPHPERTFWTQQFGQGGQGLQPPMQDKTLTQVARAFDGDQDDSRQRQGPENPEAVVEDSWRTPYSEGQTGFSRPDTRQSPVRQENHSESFRKKPNRRANSDFRSSNLPERGHYVPRKGGKGDEIIETEKSRQAVDSASSERLLEVSGGSDEDDFIEVRSKRQLQKEKQVKAKPRHSKVVKEQVPKQRNSSKSVPPRDARIDNTSLQNCLDAVVTTRQMPLTNPEVGFEKRNRSPQPAQNNSLVSDAPAFPAIVPDGPQANGSAAWGFSRANQEMVALTQIQLEEAMKPVRFEVPLPPQVPLSEHLSSALESTPSVTAKEKGPRPAAASGPVNSLLAGEKIQFGAVTMPAFSSTVSWLGPSRSEGFLGGRKELQEDSELASFGKGKRSRDNEDGANDSDAEAEAAEAEAAASAVAVAAISNDDYLHNADQLVSSHGVIGSSSSNKSSPAGLATPNGNQPSGIDEAISVSLPADLSVDVPLRGPLHSGPHLPPGSFPGLEMGALLGGPVFAFGSGGDNSRDSNVERSGGLNWQHRHGVDSFYGGPHGFAGPFGPIPSIPPHTLVYTSPFGGVGQFGQLGVSYMGPAHMPPVKQPDWKHTPVSSPAGVGSANSAEIGGMGAANGSGSGSGNGGNGNGGGGGMLYAHHNNRHLPHDPSVISVLPPGPFDLYRDMAFQSHWSHVPGPHLPSAPIPAFPPMHLRHPHPTYHMQQASSDIIHDSNMSAATAPAEASDQYLDELGLGDAMSTGSADASNSFSVQQHHQHHQQQQMPTKPPSPVSSLPAGSKLRSRVVHAVEGSSRPNSGNSRMNTSPAPTIPNFQAHSYVATASASPRRSVGHQEKRMDRTVAQQHGNHGGSKMGVATIPGSSGWSNQQQQNRKGGQGRSFASENASAKNSGGSSASMGASAVAAAKLKQVYVVKPPAAASSGSGNSDHSASEIFSADARHM